MMHFLSKQCQKIKVTRKDLVQLKVYIVSATAIALLHLLIRKMAAKQQEIQIEAASIQLEKTHLIISSPTKMQNNDPSEVNAKQSRGDEYTSCNPR